MYVFSDIYKLHHVSSIFNGSGFWTKLTEEIVRYQNAHSWLKSFFLLSHVCIMNYFPCIIHMKTIGVMQILGLENPNSAIYGRCRLVLLLWLKMPCPELDRPFLNVCGSLWLRLAFFFLFLGKICFIISEVSPSYKYARFWEKWWIF